MSAFSARASFRIRDSWPFVGILESIARRRLVTMLFADFQVPIIGRVAETFRPIKVLHGALSALSDTNIGEMGIYPPRTVCRVGHVISTILFNELRLGRASRVSPVWHLGPIVCHRGIDNFIPVPAVYCSEPSALRVIEFALCEETPPARRVRRRLSGYAGVPGTDESKLHTVAFFTAPVECRPPFTVSTVVIALRHIAVGVAQSIANFNM